MTDTKTNETTPDQLMTAFEGKSLKTIILFTVVIHAVLLIGTSVPYLWKTIAGEDTTGQSEEERMQVAAKEATAAIREIAERYQLKPQDLSSRFADGAPKAPSAGAENASPEPETDVAADNDSEEPKSEIEKEIQKVEDGPTLPPVEDEDLFK
ncbi:MAG: hypothetical protein AB8D78_14540 [Akkermansiaceae bacterium]